MKMITLGTTGITVPQNAFGALPVQRVNMDMAVQILRRAYDGGMRLKACVTRFSLPARPWDALRKISKNSWTHPYVC